MAESVRELINGYEKVLAVCGAFDMQNFGDLLFPVLAQSRVSVSGYRVEAFSPTSSDPYISSIKPRSAGELFYGKTKIDAVMIGGGYIVHNHSLSQIIKRSNPEKKNFHDNMDICWCGATLAAALRSVPIVWNAPGVPFPFASKYNDMLQQIYSLADYFSLRDKSSSKLFLPESHQGINVVPDPIAEISKIWDKDALYSDFYSLVGHLSEEVYSNCLAIHVRDRSLLGLGAESLAMLIEQFSIKYNLFPIFIAVGDAHHDAKTAKEVSNFLSIEHLVVNEPQNLKQIASLFAYSKLYVGASLHGYIAAASYGTPGVLVARPAYGKFKGFLEHIDRPEDMELNWEDALRNASQLVSAYKRTELPSKTYDSLDAHWNTINAILTHGKDAIVSSSKSDEEKFLEIMNEKYPHWSLTD